MIRNGVNGTNGNGKHRLGRAGPPAPKTEPEKFLEGMVKAERERSLEALDKLSDMVKAHRGFVLSGAEAGLDFRSALWLAGHTLRFAGMLVAAVENTDAEFALEIEEIRIPGED